MVKTFLQRILPMNRHPKETQTITAMLKIKKPDLLGNSKWGFKFLGNDIEATILDQDLLDKVRNKEISFHSGDFMKAEVEIEIVYESDGETVKRQKYSVLKMLEYNQEESAQQVTMEI